MCSDLGKAIRFPAFVELTSINMAAALQFCGVKASHHSFPRTYLHSKSSWLKFPASDSLNFSSSCCFKYARKSRGLRVKCEGGAVEVLERNETERQSLGETESQITCVMKFGGSSVASAERMREVADLIMTFPDERPVIVLSAMGKTTNKLLLVR